MQKKIEELFHQPIVVINLGLKIFAESLEEQGANVIQVDWLPMAGGDQEILDLLDKLL